MPVRHYHWKESVAEEDTENARKKVRHMQGGAGVTTGQVPKRVRGLSVL